MSLKRIPPTMAILADVLGLPLSILPGLVAWGLSGCCIWLGWANGWLVIALLLFPLVLPVSFIAMIALLRICIPRLKPGLYKMGLSRGGLAWFFTLALGRAIRLAALQELILSSYVLKYLYWKAMGAKIAFGINSSMYLDLVDLPLITVGRGAMLGDRVSISCHVLKKGKLYLAPVVIGADAEVSVDCRIGPKTTIGDGAFIGACNRLVHDTIAAGTRLENFAWMAGNPRRLEDQKSDKAEEQQPSPEG